ncbi:Glycosyltransferase [Quillaja saponaria]|uniref:Glycosyltransferase n=1 Tax=Quillaja saponaria TaxID=32244 RepID=A0AAD7PFP3_QUISA|nr:Glycosyltransferase [Quillaja saponaria]KAJ7953879.1 Glycosyltransferase [Quillaja saponaria]
MVPPTPPPSDQFQTLETNSNTLAHVALIPSAGMGHLTPFLRLAASLVQHQYCQVSLITPHPTLSLAESELISRFCSAFPQVNHIQFHLLPFDAATANATDPFWLQFESIRRSAHLLSPLLSSVSPPLSAVICDMSLIYSVLPVTKSLSLPTYILFTTSARMLAFFSCFPIVHGFPTASENYASFDGNVLEIPGIPPLPRSSISPMLLAPNSLPAKILMEDNSILTKLNGVLINTFQGLEGETLEALNNGKVIKELPHVFPVGPFTPREFERRDQSGAALKWLDDQPADSVVYVGFGSRTALTRNQIREIGDGLLKSGCRFLWVVKDKPVDRTDEEGLDEVLGHELLDNMKEKGLVVKTWVDQVEVLSHKAVGGFVSHCGWNSVTEASYCGVRVLAWPQHGDQKINAEVVEMSGLGMWMKNWGWPGEDVVKGKEIGEAIKELMSNESLKTSAAAIKEAARKAGTGVGGGQEASFKRLINEWNKNTNYEGI